MDWIGPTIAAGASLLGGAMSNLANKSETRKNRKFAREEATVSRNWSKFMSDSAHQREVNDLRTAGLNPILSANKGASSSGGVMAATPSAIPMKDVLGPAVNSALTAAQLNQTIKQSEANIKNTQQQTDVGIQEEGLKSVQHNLVQQQATNEAVKTEVNNLMFEKLQLEMTRARAEEKFYRGQGEFSKLIGFWLNSLNSAKSLTQ